MAQNGRARLRKVEIGQRGGRDAQVLGGLRESDRVIVHPGAKVRDGVRVAVARR